MTVIRGNGSVIPWDQEKKARKELFARVFASGDKIEKGRKGRKQVAGQSTSQ